MTGEFKPCPFCGHTDVDYGNFTDANCTGTEWTEIFVECPDCGATGGNDSYRTFGKNTKGDISKVYENAKNAWNARAGEEKLEDMLYRKQEY